MNPRVAENTVYSTPQYQGYRPGLLPYITRFYLKVHDYEEPNGFVEYSVAFPAVNTLA